MCSCTSDNWGLQHDLCKRLLSGNHMDSPGHNHPYFGLYKG